MPLLLYSCYVCYVCTVSHCAGLLLILSRFYVKRRTMCAQVLFVAVFCPLFFVRLMHCKLMLVLYTVLLIGGPSDNLC